MRYLLAALLWFATFATTQTAPPSTTVPVTLDHNRIIVDVRFPLPDGSKKRVRAWVDNGNPDMWITGDLAKTLALSPAGDAGKDSRVVPMQPPKEIIIGGLTIHPGDVKEVKAAMGFDSVAPGSSAEITIPSTVLRHYDVLVDYLNRELTLAPSGTMRFEGDSTRVMLNPGNGLIQIAGNLAGEKQNLALDLGASWSFISSTVFERLRKADPAWPHMTGAVGSANMWGDAEEARWELLRIPSFEYGPLTLSDVGVASFSKDNMEFFEKRAAIPTIGLIGANALLNYQVGLDYAHETVYFRQTSKHRPPDMDVVGLVLKPDVDGHYRVLGVADYEGKPAVADVKAGDILLTVDGTPPTGGTMGQAWSLLGGSPGEVRTLVFDRGGKQFSVQATVRRFLSAEAGKP